jgi:anthranilate synthase/aminodeoxychorismate synthase-like glutamine amidotransferase
MVVVLDNYDSFTFNLVHYLAELGAEVEVLRNDALSAAALLARKPSHIVISPGPCTPDQAGISLDLICAAAGRVPILGVCLGHQAIGQACGGRVVHARTVMHGKTSAIHHDGRGLFTGLPAPFTATRYHSLVVEAESLPEELEPCAWTHTADGSREELMAVRHRDWPVVGVQFHPEAILTEHGHALLANFLAGRY